MITSNGVLLISDIVFFVVRLKSSVHALGEFDELVVSTVLIHCFRGMYETWQSQRSLEIRMNETAICKVREPISGDDSS